MAIQDLTKIYEGTDLSGATSGVVYLPVVRAGTLSKIDVLTDAAASGNAVFELTRNGAAINNIAQNAPLQITIPAGSKIGSASGLTLALAVGDEIVLNLVSGGVSAPVTLNLAVDDGIGGGGYLLPDSPPPNPNSMDDEFDAATLDSKWTILNGTGTNSVVTVSSGAALLKVDATASTSAGIGIVQSLPATGDWTFRCKLAATFNARQYMRFGYGIRNSVTGKMRSLGFSCNNNHSGILDMIFSDLDAPNFPTSGTSSNSPPLFSSYPSIAQPVYFEIKKSGTNTFFAVSIDGRGFYNLGSFNASDTFGSNLPNQIGIFIETDYIRSAMSCDWFRRIS